MIGVRRLPALLLALAGAFVATGTHAKRPYAGTYIFLQKTTSVTKLPVVSDIVATTRAVSIQELAFDGKWLRGSGELCEIEIESNSKLVKTELPEAFKRALPQIVTNARIETDDDATSFTQPPQTLVIGAKLEDPATDTLPEDASDPRVVDQDRDGHPGVTVRVSGIVSGEIYLVQRSTSSLAGHATSDGFHGKVLFENEQSILDASRGALKKNPNAKPDPSRSEFVLHKVEPGVDCDAAVRRSRGW